MDALRVMDLLAGDGAFFTSGMLLKIGAARLGFRFTLGSASGARLLEKPSTLGRRLALTLLPNHRSTMAQPPLNDRKLRRSDKKRPRFPRGVFV
jgi:hypothetical protein